MNPYDSSRHFADRATPAVAGTAPSACPVCQSAAITTTAKSPDANTYWRCAACGEVWNVSRRQHVRSGAYR